MRIDVVTIFPDYLSPLRLSLLGRAQESGLVDLRVHDLRTWTRDRHRTVDDTPYGGGPGMVMRPEPWGEAIDWLLAEGAPGSAGDRAGGGGARDAGRPVGTDRSADAGRPVATDRSADAGRPVGTDRADTLPTLVVPTPSGRPMDQATAVGLAQRPWLVFACGRYEGIDQRVIDWAAQRIPVAEISLGDFVLTGGEIAAMAIIESVVRLLPGFLGNASSLDEESYADGLLEYPVYTKPPTWRGLDVPAVLLSGHHARIADWRHAEAERRTRERRPDLVRPASDVSNPSEPDG
jgi:tRNA (guanine37-N1)-methyltransferase